MPRILALLAALAFALLSEAALAGGAAKPAVRVENPDTQCVAPAEEMRRNHMEMLKHQRDRTLRLGERGAKVTLNGCIECHAGKASGAVTGSRESFCEGCHAYAAVKLDCWDCHQPKAGYQAAASAQGERQ